MTTALVLDCSVTVASCFDDERTDAVVQVLRVAAEGLVVVPPHWPVEVANVLMVAERKTRLRIAARDHLLNAIKGWSTEIDPKCHDVVFGATLELARSHRLSAYDAAYLELAIRRNLPLATLDHDLREAAVACSVTLLGV